MYVHTGYQGAVSRNMCIVLCTVLLIQLRLCHYSLMKAATNHMTVDVVDSYTYHGQCTHFCCNRCPDICTLGCHQLRRRDKWSGFNIQRRYTIGQGRRRHKGFGFGIQSELWGWWGCLRLCAIGRSTGCGRGMPLWSEGGYFCRDGAAVGFQKI